MPKFWIHYDEASGHYVPWEANTPPSPESVFRARFLSQFAAWIKYLSAMEQNDPALWFACGNESCATDHSFIYPAGGTGETRHVGTIVQSADFWRQINWKPSAAWLNARAEDMVVGTILSDPYGPLVETDDYAATEINDVEIDEVIHPHSPVARIRDYLWRIRRRIDLCHTIFCGQSNLVRLGIVRRYYWTYVDGFGEFSDDIVYPATPLETEYPNSCTTFLARYNEPGTHGIDLWAARGISLRPLAHMPVDSVIGSVLYHYVSISGTWTTSYPSTECHDPQRAVEATSQEPLTDSPLTLIDVGVEDDSHTIPASGLATIAKVREGAYHPMETPHSDYLPDGTNFTDSNDFPQLCN